MRYESKAEILNNIRSHRRCTTNQNAEIQNTIRSRGAKATNQVNKITITSVAEGRELRIILTTTQ